MRQGRYWSLKPQVNEETLVSQTTTLLFIQIPHVDFFYFFCMDHLNIRVAYFKLFSVAEFVVTMQAKCVFLHFQTRNCRTVDLYVFIFAMI